MRVAQRVVNTRPREPAGVKSKSKNGSELLAPAIACKRLRLRDQRSRNQKRRRDRRNALEGRRASERGFLDRASHAPGRPGSDLLSHALRRSTIGPGGLNDRVRDGIGWGPPGIAAGSTRRVQNLRDKRESGRHQPEYLLCFAFRATQSSPCMNVRPFKPIERLVPVSFIPRGTSTPGLSTSWSRTALKGNLVLRGVSRLDAFSVYPVRT